MLCKVAGKEALSLSNETLCFGVSYPPREPSDSLFLEGVKRKGFPPGEDCIDGSEEDGSRLRRVLLAGPRSLFRLEDAGKGRAESLSELVSFDEEDSESRKSDCYYESSQRVRTQRVHFTAHILTFLCLRREGN